MAENRNLVAPYLEWAVYTDFTHFSGEWFRVLLEVEQSASYFAWEVETSGLGDLIRVPSIYRKVAYGLKETDVTFCKAIMSREALVAIVRGRGPAAAKLKHLTSLVKRIELGTQIKWPFEKKPPRELKTISTNKSTAMVVAVIDDGLAFANERFRFASGKTRLKYFWNQDDATGTDTPQGFGWGRELTESDINALLAACTYSGIVDEDELYRKAGQNLVSRRAKHGSHVMDIACGLDPQDANASSPYLIGVQFPKWVTTETSGGLLTPIVYDAITYILSRADHIADDEGTGPLPVVINLSYGNIAGPHDGRAPIELAIDQLIAARPNLSVVLPAGNHYLARCHSHFRMKKATASKYPIESLHWRVQPDDKAASFMEIWLPEMATDGTRPQVEVRITTPSGEVSPWVLPGRFWNWPTNAKVRFRARYLDPVGERPWILLGMAPTTEMEMKQKPRTAPSGTWLVEIKNTGSEIAVEAWVQRGDTPFGYPLWGRQSRFEDSRYIRFDLAGRPEENDIGPSDIRRRGTVNALATEQRAIVVGGFRRSDYTASRYSGAGPVATPPVVLPRRRGPDAAAIADDSVALRGVLAAGTRTGSVVAMNGTSVAAPQVTRLIAEWMTSGSPCDRALLQAFAKANDTYPKRPKPAPEQRIGAGRIERPERVKLRWKRW